MKGKERRGNGVCRLVMPGLGREQRGEVEKRTKHTSVKGVRSVGKN